jgi:hypothetical protein
METQGCSWQPCPGSNQQPRPLKEQCQSWAGSHHILFGEDYSFFLLVLKVIIKKQQKGHIHYII